MAFSFQTGSVGVLVLLSVFFLAGCARSQNISIPVPIVSCYELANNIGDFQKNCQTDADCITVVDPNSFCYSETIHIQNKDQYDALFNELDCPVDKYGENNRGDYCETNWKSQNYCDQSNGMCTPGNKN